MTSDRHRDPDPSDVHDRTCRPSGDHLWPDRTCDRRTENARHSGDLEFDEIVSLRYAMLPPADLVVARLAGALFEHPPGYYVSLGAWLAMAEKVSHTRAI